MAGFRTKDVLPYLEAKLAALPGMQEVQRGEPLDPPANVNAYIMVGGQQPLRKYASVFQRTGRFLVMFAVRVNNAEDDAEDVLADLVDSFEVAILADPTCGGLTTGLDLNTAPADNPEYRRLYGPEFRLYPFEVVVTQTVHI
jgi:hypothetical protein